MAAYIDLVEKLTEKDKKTLTTYITKYGCMGSEFVGIEKWLQNWSHANQKLYKMLGNQLIYEIPFTYEKPEKEVEREIDRLYYEENNFRSNYVRFFRENEAITDEDQWKFTRLSNVNWIAQNKVPFTIKYRKPEAKKMLQIQEGAKWFRAMGQIIEYFKDDWDWDKKEFEELRKKHAIIFSEKIIKGSLCLSIHPLDYITMSDNSLNWTSCMNWAKDGGCYHAGTIEMMNSNNVICTYLKDKSPYVFDENNEYGVWNNKRWRQLIYATKDIIMTGKPYPYVSFDLRVKTLEVTKDLAKENLNWTYKFGPERYNDMVHIGNLSKMDQQRGWMRAKSYKKHNIIWDTKGMYNDMLNDPSTNYQCYRNAVDHTKIISVSGKCNCLSCNQPLLEENWDNEYEYNDRYSNTSEVICKDCMDTKFKCNYCHEGHEVGDPLVNSDLNGRICPECLNNFVRRCPCCGKLTYIDSSLSHMYYNPYVYESLMQGEKNRQKLSKFLHENGSRTINIYVLNDPAYSNEELDNDLRDKIDLHLLGLYCCNGCRHQLWNEIYHDPSSVEIEFDRMWFGHAKYTFVDPAKAEKYLWRNLEKATLEDFQTERVLY